ncbi:hypothetical protein F506_07585 [Herbaspirillum hiltneri N3]|uniref:Uncharacterized protein n=1 Tax=Herbaspirillum hiltneri N3 TaxID=1262470 RepID=A0ABM5UZ80_9BURK|nr:hypothetical protein F506_07585 [Herbaspirillum hiltneri N3]
MEVRNRPAAVMRLIIIRKEMQWQPVISTSQLRAIRRCILTAVLLERYEKDMTIQRMRSLPGN